MLAETHLFDRGRAVTIENATSEADKPRVHALPH